MRATRFLFASAALNVVALAWNGVVHRVLLKGTDASLRRLRCANLGETMPVSIFVTLGVAMVFVRG